LRWGSNLTPLPEPLIIGLPGGVFPGMRVLCIKNFAEFLSSASIALSSSVVMKFLSAAVLKTHLIVSLFL